MAPGRIPARMPSGPDTTARIESSSARLEITISAPATAAAGDLASVAPSSRSGDALSEERFQTTSGWPARLTLAAIAAPILPSPMKAIFSCSVEDFIAGHPIFVGNRQNDDPPNNPTNSRVSKVELGPPRRSGPAKSIRLICLAFASHRGYLR